MIFELGIIPDATLNKFSNTGIPAIYLRHFSFLLQLGAEHPLPRGISMQVKGKHGSVWSEFFSLKQRQRTGREGEVGDRNVGGRADKKDV